MSKLTVSSFDDVKSLKETYLTRIDDVAEQARERLITKGAGQSMTYEAKYLEALKGEGPFLRAEAKALNTSVSQVIDSILQARERWEVQGAVIEANRLKAKHAMKRATTASEMHVIVSGLIEKLTT